MKTPEHETALADVAARDREIVLLKGQIATLESRLRAVSARVEAAKLAATGAAEREAAAKEDLRRYRAEVERERQVNDHQRRNFYKRIDELTATVAKRDQRISELVSGRPVGIVETAVTKLRRRTRKEKVNADSK